MIIRPWSGDRPRNGSAVMMSASRTAATVRAEERRPAAGERRAAQHRGGDAVQRVAVADRRVPDSGAGHDEERGDGREHGRQEERPHADPVRPDAVRAWPRARRSPWPAAARPEPVAWSQSRRGPPRRRRDERHGDGPMRAGAPNQVAVDDAPGRLSQGERDAVEDAERGERGDDRRDLQTDHEDGVHESQGHAAEEDRPDPEQDLGRKPRSPIRNEATTTPRLIMPPPTGRGIRPAARASDPSRPRSGAARSRML